MAGGLRPVRGRWRAIEGPRSETSAFRPDSTYSGMHGRSNAINTGDYIPKVRYVHPIQGFRTLDWVNRFSPEHWFNRFGAKYWFDRVNGLGVLNWLLCVDRIDPVWGLSQLDHVVGIARRDDGLQVGAVLTRLSPVRLAEPLVIGQSYPLPLISLRIGGMLLDGQGAREFAKSRSNVEWRTLSGTASAITAPASRKLASDCERKTFSDPT